MPKCLIVPSYNLHIGSRYPLALVGTKAIILTKHKLKISAKFQLFHSHALFIVTLAGDVFLFIQQTFSSSDTDGSFTAGVSNSFLSPLEKSYSCRLATV